MAQAVDACGRVQAEDKAGVHHLQEAQHPLNSQGNMSPQSANDLSYNWP